MSGKKVGLGNNYLLFFLIFSSFTYSSIIPTVYINNKYIEFPKLASIMLSHKNFQFRPPFAFVLSEEGENQLLGEEQTVGRLVWENWDIIDLHRTSSS